MMPTAISAALGVTGTCDLAAHRHRVTAVG